MTRMVRACILTSSDSSGGAARAAMRVGAALQDAGVEIEALVDIKRTSRAWVSGPPGAAGAVAGMIRRRVERGITKLQTPVDAYDRSFNILRTCKAQKINNGACDIVNIHWIGNGFISIKDISRIRRPVVWTLHDMWTFCGAEHYAPDDASARWRLGYPSGSRASGSSGLDLDALVWRIKQKTWKKRYHVVVPSRWLADCVRGSALMQDWPVTVIPNPIDMASFQPVHKASARKFFGLPLEAPLITFGSFGGTADVRKGFDLLLCALARLAGKLPAAEGVVFGQSKPEAFSGFPMKLHWLGHLGDESALAKVYSAADVMAVPSRLENLPQAATEAQACGCPVVAFSVGGIPDTICDGVTGLLAKPFDVEDLSSAIFKLLTDSDLRSAFGVAARERAMRLWGHNEIARQYLDVFRQAMHEAR